jgi:hypothetical protein
MGVASAFLAALFIAVPILFVLIVGFIAWRCTGRTQSRTQPETIVEISRGNIIQENVKSLSESDGSNVMSVKNPVDNIGTVEVVPKVVNLVMSGQM